MISLLAGKPNSSSFPFTSLSFSTVYTAPGSNTTEESTLTLSDKELAEGLQYGDTAGLKQLLDWVHSLQEFSHGRRKGEGWRVSVGSGSQDLLYKVGTNR